MSVLQTLLVSGLTLSISSPTHFSPEQRQFSVTLVNSQLQNEEFGICSSPRATLCPTLKFSGRIDALDAFIASVCACTVEGIDIQSLFGPLISVQTNIPAGEDGKVLAVHRTC